MPHQTSEEYLDSDNINEYFEALAEEIKKAGIGKHQVLIVGGAAMALKFQDGRSTVDIDICIQEQNHLYDCCLKIAEKYDLPDDWINADVMHSDSFSYRLFNDAVLYGSYAKVLDVYVASDIDLYCMKLISFRPKDIQDMEVLAQKLTEDGITKSDIVNKFKELYGDEFLMKDDSRKEQFLNMQFT